MGRQCGCSGGGRPLPQVANEILLQFDPVEVEETIGLLRDGFVAQQVKPPMRGGSNGNAVTLRQNFAAAFSTTPPEYRRRFDARLAPASSPQPVVETLALGVDSLRPRGLSTVALRAACGHLGSTPRPKQERTSRRKFATGVLCRGQLPHTEEDAAISMLLTPRSLLSRASSPGRE